MARTALTVQKTVRTNLPPVKVAATESAIDATAVSQGVVVGDFFNVENPILVAKTSTNALNLTLVASTDSNAIKAGIGNFIAALEANKTYVFDQIEAGRFQSGSGALNINLDAVGGTLFATGTAKGIG